MGIGKVFVAALIGYVINFFGLSMIAAYIPTLGFPYSTLVIQGVVFGLVVALIFKLLKGN